MSEQCRHSSTAKRPTRKKEEHEYKSCFTQFFQETFPHKHLPPTYPVVCTSALSVTSSVVVTSLATVTTLSPQVRPRRQDSQDFLSSNEKAACDRGSANQRRESPGSCCLVSESLLSKAERSLSLSFSAPTQGILITSSSSHKQRTFHMLIVALDDSYFEK